MADTSTKPAVETAADDVAALNLWQKLAAITGEVGTIAKDGKNREQGYNFIEYAAVAGALRSLFAKYRVVCIPNMGERTEREITTSNGRKGLAVTINFEFTFINADKPAEIQQVNWVGEAADYGDKATNKAATAALKYCLMRTFNVSEKGDEDPDSTTIDRGIHRQSDSAPKKMTIQDAIAKAFAALSAKGFKEPDERKTVLMKIAGVSDAQELTGEVMVHVLSVLEITSGHELRGYLEAEKPEEVKS